MKSRLFNALLVVSFFAVTLSCFGQSKTVFQGKVVDANNQIGLPGALIEVLNTRIQIVTAEDGSFTVELSSAASQEVQITYLGYETKVMKVNMANYDGRIMSILLASTTTKLEEVLVSATRAPARGVFTTETIDGKSLNARNLGQDLPILLNQTTSIVTSSDAGNGVGYTGLRIRGTDPTRVNVTINGIPVNDAESHGVFWVNMPDLASSANSIQIQRGVGSSSNGAGAFGASVNIQTNTLEKDAYFMVNSAAGSFSTFKNTLSVGTGLINNIWTVDARASYINSDGYIDRATTDLQSLYLSAGAYFKNDIFKFIAMRGKERTYQAWNGVLEDSLKTNRTYNYTGEYTDENGQIQYYEDEVDNYAQDNYQLHWIKNINKNFQFNLAGHYTRGLGYFEQYREGQRLSNYGLANVTVGQTTISRTSLIRQRWLDNHFGGFVFSANANLSNDTKLILGGGWNRYDGDHYGKVIWAQFASNGQKGHEYYNDNAVKDDANVYLKVEQRLNQKLTTFLDLQVRSVDYSFIGINDRFQNVPSNSKLNFFNPKFGLLYTPTNRSEIFSSFAIANKEPNRNDFTENLVNVVPKPERLYDLEIGLRTKMDKLQYNLTLYNMAYTDQLILTGKINDVGEYVRVNIPSSFRRGAELEVIAEVLPKFIVRGNMTLSQNKIKEFTEYQDQYDADFNSLPQKELLLKNTDIAFSPSVIGALSLDYEVFKSCNVSLANKYVGRQYLDNTQTLARSIPSFLTNDLMLTYNTEYKNVKELSYRLQINNITNAKYANNGYTFGYSVEGQREDFNYFFPQAGINFMLGVSFRL